VTVTFSEAITGPNGADFSWSSVKPGDALAVYHIKVTGAGYDTIANALDNIASFSRFVNDSTIEFGMSNGKDITANNYFNIKSQAGQIFDSRPSTGNPPVADNRKAQVTVVSGLPPKITVVPNPSKPTFVHAGEGYGPGEFYFRNEPQAREWVKREGAGTVITFQIPPPSAGDTIKGVVNVYDVIGNLVNHGETDNVLASLKYNKNDTKSEYSYDIYWNGSNSRGQKVAPGTYRTVVYLTYKSAAKTENKRLWGLVGIAY
jgi:hypothetical protein